MKTNKLLYLIYLLFLIPLFNISGQSITISNISPGGNDSFFPTSVEIQEGSSTVDFEVQIDDLRSDGQVVIMAREFSNAPPVQISDRAEAVFGSREGFTSFASLRTRLNSNRFTNTGSVIFARFFSFSSDRTVDSSTISVSVIKTSPDQVENRKLCIETNVITNNVITNANSEQTAVVYRGELPFAITGSLPTFESTTGQESCLNRVTGEVKYQWFRSSNNDLFYPITGATERSYLPSRLSASQYYKRRATIKFNDFGIGISSFSNVIKLELREHDITVSPTPIRPNTPYIYFTYKFEKNRNVKIEILSTNSVFIPARRAIVYEGRVTPFTTSRIWIVDRNIVRPNDFVVNYVVTDLDSNQIIASGRIGQLR